MNLATPCWRQIIWKILAQEVPNAETRQLTTGSVLEDERI